jgi:hypothetical protein
MITMCVWSQRVYDHNICMIKMSVWFQCLYDHVCMIPMFVWSQCVYDHVCMITISVWSKCLYDPSVCMITSAWRQCMYDYNVCIFTKSAWFQRLYDHNVHNLRSRTPQFHSPNSTAHFPMPHTPPPIISPSIFQFDYSPKMLVPHAVHLNPTQLRARLPAVSVTRAVAYPIRYVNETREFFPPSLPPSANYIQVLRI